MRHHTSESSTRQFRRRSSILTAATSAVGFRSRSIRFRSSIMARPASAPWRRWRASGKDEASDASFKYFTPIHRSDRVLTAEKWAASRRSLATSSLGARLPQLRNQRLNLTLLVRRRIELERFLELLHRLGSVALLRVSHPQVEAIRRLVRLFGHQVLEDIDGVVRQSLLEE